MNKCGHCKALRGAEAQVLRHGKTVIDLIKLLRNVREDGGLNEAQCQHMDNLVARNEAIMAGLAESHPDGQANLHVLRETGAGTIHQVITGYNLLREVAVECAALAGCGQEDGLHIDDKVVLEPRFGLVLGINRLFAGEELLAGCDSMETGVVACVVGAKRPIAPTWESAKWDQASGLDHTARAHVIPDECLREIAAELVEGLTSHGADHKQFHMEEALRLLVPEEFTECKDSWRWGDGIPE